MRKWDRIRERGLCAPVRQSYCLWESKTNRSCLFWFGSRQRLKCDMLISSLPPLHTHTHTHTNTKFSTLDELVNKRLAPWIICSWFSQVIFARLSNRYYLFSGPYSALFVILFKGLLPRFLEWILHFCRQTGLSSVFFISDRSDRGKKKKIIETCLA